MRVQTGQTEHDRAWQLECALSRWASGGESCDGVVAIDSLGESQRKGSVLVLAAAGMKVIFAEGCSGVYGSGRQEGCLRTL